MACPRCSTPAQAFSRSVSLPELTQDRPWSVDHDTAADLPECGYVEVVARLSAAECSIEQRVRSRPWIFSLSGRAESADVLDGLGRFPTDGPPVLNNPIIGRCQPFEEWDVVV